MRSEPKGNLATMIMETAFMEIVPGKELEFEAAMEKAKAVVSEVSRENSKAKSSLCPATANAEYTRNKLTEFCAR
jgi:hypothetical protein